MTARLGLNVPNFGTQATPQRFRHTIARAEGAGFDLVMVSDHVAMTPDVSDSYPPPFLEGFTLLGWVAGITTTLAIGTTVTVLPYRHPLLVGAMAETLNRLSEGRFVLGVGVGWAVGEFDALGIDHAARGAIMDDFLAALRAQQRAEGHRGPFASFPPVDSGRYAGPIWVGGNSQRAIQRAGRFGDAWHPLGVSMRWVHDVGLPQLNAHSAGRRVGFAPRLKLRPVDDPVDVPARPLGLGTWDQIGQDLAEVIGVGADAVVLDMDTPESRRGADPWPSLERAAAIIRDVTKTHRTMAYE